jgi:Tfp pilus tip-associated adhesin PilY1
MASELAAEERANEIIVRTLVEKEGTVDVPDPASPGDFIQSPITYLLGDIFHADPVILSRPSSSNYYSSDPYVGKQLCGAAPDPDRLPPISYRWFADRHFCRRSILFTAANDGQLHAFDGGIFEDAGSGLECLLPAKDADGDGIAEVDEFADGVIDYDIDDDVQGNKSCTSDSDCGSGPCSGGFCRDVLVGVVDGAYNNGSGREVFSYIPRAMLPTVAKMAGGAERNTEFWGMDSGPRIDDVFIDPLASDSGSVTCLAREWRTVAIGGYREGGPGYYALDVTQPDTLNDENVPEPDSGYVPSCTNGGSACGNRPYPAVLWEFQDHHLVDLGSGFVDVALDEDLNGLLDLGNSWSKATTGRIRVCTGSCTDEETEDRFVAIFGGGLGNDPAHVTGNFIYMVDIETGKAIYKKQVTGSVAGDVAAVDFNGDSYIDRLYFGTTAGFLYKVQLETSPNSPMLIASIPNLKTRIAGSNYDLVVERITGPTGDENRYNPYRLFTTGGRPIYHEVSIIYVAAENRAAMAFGTGNRWDLWHFDGQTGRFYMLLDDEFQDTDRDGVLDVSCSGCTEPLTEAKYQSIALNAAATSTPLLYQGLGTNLPGWYFPLPANERVITEAFSLSGITSFTSFEPTEAPNDDGTCTRAGRSHIFIVGTVTGNGYVAGDRFTEVPQFTTPLFVEQSATKNPEGGGSGSGHADVMTDALREIRDELKNLQPTRCKYANYTQNIKTIRSDTGVVFVAPIPICIDPTSWKEF